MRNELNSADPLPRRPGTATASSFSGALPGVYRGLIIVRDDPDKQGRVKVALPHIFGDVPADELPWIYPITSAWNTSDKEKPAGGTTNVPPLGAPVVVMFEGGDHRYPMYIGGSFGKPGFADNMPDHAFSKNPGSPDNYSFTSPRGTTMMCDERPGKEKVFFANPEGDYVSMSKAGLIEVKAKGTVSVKGANLVSIQCDTQIQTKAQQVLLYATGDVVVEGGSTVNVNAGSTVNIQAGKINLNCGSSQTAKENLKEVDTQPVFDRK